MLEAKNAAGGGGTEEVEIMSEGLLFYVNLTK